MSGATGGDGAIDVGIIGVGVVGCGGMGSWHAGNLAAQPGVRLVAVADMNPDAASSLAARVGARVDDADALIQAADVDAVVVASSDDSHARYVTAALAASKPCLVEKPLAVTLDDARAILDAEVAAGQQLLRVGFMRELDPAHAQVADALGLLGPVTKVRCVHRNVDAAPRPVTLLFAQSIIHDIHSVRWLTGQEFAAVTVHVAERPDGFRDVLMIGELTGGALAVIEFEDQGFAYEVQVEVTTVGGMAATLPHPRAVRRSGGKEALLVGADWFARFEDAYRLEIEEWTRTLRPTSPTNAQSAAPGPTAWDGFAAQVVADAAERAMVSGAKVVVELPERPALYGTPSGAA